MLSSMENYTIVGQLGDPEQSTVFIVEHKIDGKKYVLKKVECADESETNKTFREALALQNLEHAYIGIYKEFFVQWDPQDCAIYLCIVMEYYSEGTLAHVIAEKRNAQENIDELFIKKCLGQMVEALIFVNSKNIIHRNLRTSNVFMFPDSSICIGDFGMATVVGDVQRSTRAVRSGPCYHAPELKDGIGDVQCDIYSLGSIILEMTTCAILTEDEFKVKLEEIKEDSIVLEEFFEEIAKVYSGSLIGVIRTMLKYNHKSRSSAAMLAEIPYISECLQLSNSLAIAKQRRQAATLNRIGPPPTEKGEAAIIEYIETFIEHESAVCEALDYLVAKSNEELLRISQNGRRVISDAMKSNMEEERLLLVALALFNSLIVTAESGDALYSPEIISNIILAMKRHSSNLQIQQAGCSLLMSISADVVAAEVIGLHGGLEAVLSVLRSSKENPELCAICCNALWSLAVNKNNIKLLTDMKALRDVSSVLSTHIDNADVSEAAAAALLSLSLDDEVFHVVHDLDCISLLMTAVEKHIRNARVIKNACMALAAYVEPDEESAYKLLNIDTAEGTGISVILKAFELHRDNAEVVESICTLIMELAEYDDIRQDLVILNVVPFLQEVTRKFTKNEEVMKPCTAALLKLGST